MTSDSTHLSASYAATSSGQVEGRDPAGDAEHRPHPVGRGEQPLDRGHALDDHRAGPARRALRPVARLEVAEVGHPRVVRIGDDDGCGTLRSSPAAEITVLGPAHGRRCGRNRNDQVTAQAGTKDSVDAAADNSSSVEFISR